MADISKLKFPDGSTYDLVDGSALSLPLSCIGNEYDAQTSYSIGDAILSSGGIYIFNSAHGAGEGDPSAKLLSANLLDIARLHFLANQFCPDLGDVYENEEYNYSGMFRSSRINVLTANTWNEVTFDVGTATSQMQTYTAVIQYYHINTSYTVKFRAVGASTINFPTSGRTASPNESPSFQSTVITGIMPSSTGTIRVGVYPSNLGFVNTTYKSATAKDRYVNVYLVRTN